MAVFLILQTSRSLWAYFFTSLGSRKTVLSQMYVQQWSCRSITVSNFYPRSRGAHLMKLLIQEGSFLQWTGCKLLPQVDHAISIDRAFLNLCSLLNNQVLNRDYTPASVFCLHPHNQEPNLLVATPLLLLGEDWIPVWDFRCISFNLCDCRQRRSLIVTELSVFLKGY